VSNRNSVALCDNKQADADFSKVIDLLLILSTLFAHSCEITFREMTTENGLRIVELSTYSDGKSMIVGIIMYKTSLHSSICGETFFLMSKVAAAIEHNRSVHGVYCKVWGALTDATYFTFVHGECETATESSTICLKCSTPVSFMKCISPIKPYQYEVNYESKTPLELLLMLLFSNTIDCNIEIDKDNLPTAFTDILFSVSMRSKELAQTCFDQYAQEVEDVAEGIRLYGDNNMKK
jgi:hypothetical protein